MAVAREQILDVVDRLLNSRAFSTSGTHRRLLRYLAERSLAGEGADLKEYVIAVEALGKPATYDPHSESAARLQVARLRQKIGEYYRNEGKDERLVVDLPKGGFQMTFQEVETRAARKPWRLAAVALAVALVISLVAAGYASHSYMALRSKAPQAEAVWTPEMEAVWAPFLSRERPLTVCIGTPLFVSKPGVGYVRNPEINEPQPGPGEYPIYLYAGVGEAAAGFHLGSLLGTRRRDLTFTRSSSLSWEELTNHNVVFIGPPKFNRQLDQLLQGLDLTMDSNGIYNLRPRSGEPEAFKDTAIRGRGGDGECYALISRVQGPRGASELLVLASNIGSGTQAAAQWLSDPRRVAHLDGLLRGSDGSAAKRFQILIRVKYRNRVPVESAYVLHREL